MVAYPCGLHGIVQKQTQRRPVRVAQPVEQRTKSCRSVPLCVAGDWFIVTRRAHTNGRFVRMMGWLRKQRGRTVSVSTDAPFRRAEHVVSTVEGDRTVLLDPRGGEYFGLDEVGTRIWALLPDHPTAERLADRLFEEYAAPRETLAADAARLLGELAAMKLVVRA